ncbi:HNH endonuclease [Demequina lutea]|uniref:HNH nuclease domain-containing protein n=1 Tax=Demequina lutea TaxID=431489 RepID=A0A7Z0CJJ7_9MICO|nr:HNH endonuclease signature motif containing protein [Demequina lutea]NYI40847.1 hypothetical protein [Demequina lutea]
MAIVAAEISRVSALVGVLARRDVSDLPDAAFLEAHDEMGRLERLVGTWGARFAGDVARRSAPDLPGGGLARRQGFGSAGAMVARVTGGTTAGAMRSIEAGLALMPAVVLVASPDGSLPTQSTTPPAPRYPAVAQAAHAGDLAVDAAGLITAGLETLAERVPSERLQELERRLVDRAVHLAVHEVRRLVAHAVAHADLAGHEQRERRQHEERFLAWKEDHTGMVTFTGKLDAVTAAPIRTVIEQIVTHQFRARRDQDPSQRDQRTPDLRTVGQMRADALFEVCRHALGCKETDRSGIRTTIIVRMSLRDRDTGTGLGSIDGTNQPVSVGQLRRLAGDAGIIAEVLGGESEVLDLGRRVRLFTPAQRLALLERDGGCAKCHAPPEHCEAHHIRWWERGGPTDLANGVMLCTRCHHDIHRQGWNIQVEHGRVNFIPPPHIDPTCRPRPGGLAAITIDIGNLTGGGDLSDMSNPGDPGVTEELCPPPDNPARNDLAWDDAA